MTKWTTLYKYHPVSPTHEKDYTKTGFKHVNITKYTWKTANQYYQLKHTKIKSVETMYILGIIWLLPSSFELKFSFVDD